MIKLPQYVSALRAGGLALPEPALTRRAQMLHAVSLTVCAPGV
jgi:hypothetical protein